MRDKKTNMRNNKTKGENMKTSKPSYTEKNKIWPQEDAAKTKGSLDMSMFSKDALGSEIATTKGYEKTGSKNAVQACGYIKENMIAPDATY